MPASKPTDEYFTVRIVRCPTHPISHLTRGRYLRNLALCSCVIVVGCIVQRRTADQDTTSPTSGVMPVSPVSLPSVPPTPSTRASDLQSRPVQAGQEYTWKSPTSVVCPPVSLVRPDGGAPVSVGGEVANASQVVAGMRRRYRNCFNALLARDRNAEGHVDLTYRIDCEGRVTTMKAISRGLDHEAIECLFRTGEQARFDTPAGGSAVIKVPVTFVRVEPKNDSFMPDAG